MATSYEQRNEQRAASCNKLNEVVTLGVSTGLWTVVSTQAYEATDTWRYATVKTVADGLHFSLTGGSWNKENAINCSIASVKNEFGIQVSSRDVMDYEARQAGEITANASAAKSASAIIKDLCRRVINAPSAVAIATKINERLATMTAQRATLRAHMATLESMGYSFHMVDNAQTYSAQAYKPGMPALTVYCDGRITFDASTSIVKLANVLASL